MFLIVSLCKGGSHVSFVVYANVLSVRRLMVGDRVQSESKIRVGG